MIDTVRCRVSGDWKSKVAGWTDDVREGYSIGENGEGRERQQRWMCHQETGLRIMGDAMGPAFVELSLPRQLYPHNGYLLGTPEAIREAWARGLERVSRVADVTAGKLTRLDLVWQFRGDPPAWVQALGSSRHPKVRKNPSQFFGESVTWQGKETVLRVYDKALEVLGEPGDVVRLESQLRGKALEKAVGAVDVQSLAFGACWKAYRDTWAVLPAFRIWDRDRALTIAGFLALLQAEGITVNGMPAEDIYLLARAERTQRLLRSQMAKMATQELLSIDLAKVLPVDHPPEVVHLAVA